MFAHIYQHAGLPECRAVCHKDLFRLPVCQSVTYWYGSSAINCVSKLRMFTARQ